MAAAAPEAIALRGILLAQTRLTEEQLGTALERGGGGGGADLLEAVREASEIDESELLRAVGEALGMHICDGIDATQIDPAWIERIPIAFAKDHALLPLFWDGRTLRVAVADPLATDPLDDLHLLFDDCEVVPELASRRQILAAINQVYDRGPASAEALAADASDDLAEIASEIRHEPQDLLEAADDAPIVRLINSLLQQAVKERASDVHLEPFEGEVRVRFRIDDILYEPVRPLPRTIHAAVASRVKIMGGLNIAEKRLPQDGRIGLKIAGRDYDVRLSTVPISYGERVVMRLLPRSADLLDLERLGFNPQHQRVMERLIARPNGIILVTGPTGSGKTTTLYAALSRINTPDKNIITIEDPVEIQLPGIGQIEVNPKIGLSFANGLRSILRQDPNVVLVGEIRDLETAEIAIQASLTGHLVFSTLHTNDAPSAVTRLADMGVERFLVASSLVAVLAQRLVRVLCVKCREAYVPSREELAEVGIPDTAPRPKLYRPCGCDACGHTGYRGRIGIFELMLVDDPVRELINRRVDAKAILHCAMRGGMATLRADGARLAAAGITSIAEVLRATEEEPFPEDVAVRPTPREGS